MAFVDEVTLQVRAGRGGNGVVRWLRTKEKARGGPSGGDGGNGGDVVLVGVRDLAILAQYRHEKKFAAADGEAGRAFLQQGARGADARILVPVGTSVSIEGSPTTYEILHEGQELRLFKGGAGGFGNTHFKSSVHQNPFEYTEGRPGESGNITLILKIIADLGIIGLPNAGKSSLINALTRAKSKVGAYPFTTLEPHLGEFYGFILADIPGLIEGASTGRGLGTKFLKHIERTGSIAHLVSAEQDNLIAAYKEVRREVEQYGKGIAEKDEFLVVSKADLVSKEDLKKKVTLLEKELGKKVYTVSTQDPSLLKHFSDELIRELQRHTQSS